MKTAIKTTALIAATGSLVAIATPASAAEFPTEETMTEAFASPFEINTTTRFDDDDWDDDDRRYRRGRGYRGHRDYDRRGRYREPRRINRRDRVWRGRDGNYYCERGNGTTGLVIGAGLGALAGRAVDTRGDRTVGTLLGALAGGLLGREIDRGELRCR